MYSSRSTLCSAEFGSKVFAIFNLILFGITSLATTIGITFCVAKAIIDYKNNSDSGGHGLYLMLLVGSGLFILMILSWVAFMFAVFLVNGVFKKKPEHMQAYYVYGIIVEILSVFATVAYFLLARDDDIEIPISILIVCFFYALILMMIKKTYTKYQTLDQQYSHKPLNEKC